MTQELTALREAVRALLARTPPAEAWPKLCAEVGVAGLAIPERYDGAGAGLPELCVVAEELGRTLTPAPLLGSAVLTATALLAGDADARTRLLPRIAAGATAALAWTGADGRWDPAHPACHWDSEKRHLSGTAHYVLDGATADVLVVAARTPAGVGLFEVDPADAQRTPTPTLDAARALSTVTLDRTPAVSLSTEATEPLRHARDVARVALAAEQVGAAAHCLETTVAYTKQRVQYGHPISRFQALQHRLADLYVQVETARSAVWAAAHARGTELPLLAAVARIHCTETLNAAAAEMIQIHGGIAITWEHEAHRYFKRAHSSAQLFGQPGQLLRESGFLSE